MYVVKDYEVGTPMDIVDNEVEELLIDQGFDSQGYFSGGYCDWFSIGGRWSTVLLSYKVWGKGVWEKAREMLDLPEDLSWSDPRHKDVAKTVEKLVKAISGDKTPSSEVLTESLLESLKLHDADTEVFLWDECEMVTCKDLSKELIGKSTITIVDYHN